MTLDQLINRIKLVVSQTTGGKTLDTEVPIEVLLPRVFDKVASDFAKDASTINYLRSNHTVVFTSGSGPVPSSVNPEFFETIVFATNFQYSYIRDYFDFLGEKDDPSAVVNFFTVANGNIILDSTYSGSLTISCITVPDVPTAPSTTVVATDNFINQVISYTAAVLTGSINLKEVGLAQ
jgi:hypothetical protein